MRIVLLSDTHGYFDDRMKDYCSQADEVWHAGDLGNEAFCDWLEQFPKVRYVYGNIDGTEVRKRCAEDLMFEVNGLRVFMTHIGGRPPAYPARISHLIQLHKIDVFICGHSHICMAGRNERIGNLHLNPGAAGKHGFHKLRTMMRFDVLEGKVKNLQVIELGPRAERIPNS